MKKLLILCCLSQFMLWSCSQAPEQKEMKSTFVMSDKMLKTTHFATAKNETLLNELQFFGKIAADNNKMIEVFPVVGGNVMKVYVELGDYVTKNQLLATIRSTEVAGYEKDLDDAKNDLIVARNNLKVAQEMYDGKLNTERDVIEAKSTYEKAQSQLNRVEETYRIYNIRKGAIYEVRAPINGFVIEKKVNENMLLRSDKTDNIFDIAEIDDVWALANVNESDIAQVQIGQNAAVTTISYPDRIFSGKVDKLFNFIDPETKAMKVRIKLQNQDFLLKPEMRATIKISFQENEKMIAVPSSSLVFDKSKNFVMVFHNRNEIITRQVEVFRQVGEKVFISSGLAPGEKILTTNQLLIYDALND